MDLTPQATADVISATGPIYLPECRRVVTGNNVDQLADYYAHWATRSGPSTSGSAETQRKQFIGIVARHVLQRIEKLSVRTLIKLGQAVGTAIEHGDLLVNFRNPSLQSLIQQAGASHNVTPQHGDYLYVVNTNLSYNKINPYVHLASSYDVRIRTDRWLHARLTIRLHNVSAPSPLAQAGFGPGAGALGKPDDYATFLRIYTPPGALLIDQTGWTQPWSQGPAYGGTIFPDTSSCDGEPLAPCICTTSCRPTCLERPRGSGIPCWRHTSRVACQIPCESPSGTMVRGRVGWSITQRWTCAFRCRLPRSLFTRYRSPSFPPPATSPGGWIEPHAFLAAPNPHG